MTATDYSSEAIARAEQRYGPEGVDFRIVDMTQRLPFADAEFDAVMSNVAAHMFSDANTRALFAEAARVLRPGGLLLLHVNADSDRVLRAVHLPVKRELEPDFVLEESGQTVHFFSRDYLVSVLSAWDVREMTHVEIPHATTGEPFKRVWRVVARKPLSP